jgi:hypothetical protein
MCWSLDICRRLGQGNCLKGLEVLAHGFNAGKISNPEPGEEIS